MRSRNTRHQDGALNSRDFTAVLPSATALSASSTLSFSSFHSYVEAGHVRAYLEVRTEMPSLRAVRREAAGTLRKARGGEWEREEGAGQALGAHLQPFPFPSKVEL